MSAGNSLGATRCALEMLGIAIPASSDDDASENEQGALSEGADSEEGSGEYAWQ